MASTTKPYRRIGDNSWGELLDQVNEILQNPVKGCDPITEIEIPEPKHIWTKADIREIHNKLNEMPGNCFEFQEIPDKWKISIIEDIENQLENAWCDCEYEAQTIFLLSVGLDNSMCRESSPYAGCDVEHVDWSSEMDTFTTQRDIFRDAFIAVCDLQNELETLELELVDLQDELVILENNRDTICGADPGSGECINAQNAVTTQETKITDKETEIEDKEKEIEDKEKERDEAKTLYLAAGQAANDAYRSAATGEQGGVPLLDLVMNKPPPEEINCDCCSSNPFRFQESWVVQQRSIEDPMFLKCWKTPYYTNWTSWNGQLFGIWDIEGNPIVTHWPGCSNIVQQYKCGATSCAGGICMNGEEFVGCGAPDGHRTVEYRLTYA